MAPVTGPLVNASIATAVINVKGTTLASTAPFMPPNRISSNPEQLPHLVTSTSSVKAGFLFTFEVEGHSLVSRQIDCEIEGRRSEPLRGSGGMLPQETFKTEVSQKHIFLQSGKEIFLG